MSGYHFFHPPVPPVLRQQSCPSCYNPFVMLPQKCAVFPAEDEFVSLSTVYDLLDEQEHCFTELLQQQERSYRAFLQMLMDSTSSRMDSLVRELQDLRNCLQKVKTELVEVKKQGVQNSKQADCLAEGLVMVRGAVDGLSVKSGGTGGGSGGGGGVNLKQRKGGPGLRLEGGGRLGGRAVKKPEPKAMKLVADLTDIQFDNIKVVLVHTHAVKDFK